MLAVDQAAAVLAPDVHEASARALENLAKNNAIVAPEQRETARALLRDIICSPVPPEIATLAAKRLKSLQP